MRTSPLEPPKDINQALMAHGPDSLYGRTARHLYALASVAASLAVLDQLVLQAVLSDQNPLVDSNNVITATGGRSHLAGVGTTIVCQPDARIHMATVDVGDLILADGDSLGVPLGELWRVESMSFQFSADLGSTLEMVMREIDGDLNPFGPLVRLL